ncbi:MAG: CAP domain-containing protein [Polyangiaceae bacterium]|nr:CAP domain-containing protein [Polyangiaceae bacterium]
MKVRHKKSRTPISSALVALGVSLAGALGIAHAEVPALAWKATTSSPTPATAASNVSAFQSLCGTADGALASVADRNVKRQLEGAEIFAADELGFTLRAAGDPHVWPRAFSLAGGALDEEGLKKKVTTWMSGWSTLGVRRCGLAKGSKEDGTTVFSMVAIDALADMTSFPVTARVSQWITLEGKMLVPATAAKVVLLGPRGAPKTVIASLSGDKIKSTFSVDQPGQWLVQVLATVSTGPRPVLEAYVFAGVTPPTKFTRASVPGEDAGKEVKDDAEAVLKMLNTARIAEGQKALTRDSALDKLAKAHSDEMAKAKMVGHDVGTGDPAARIKAAGVKAKIAAENVASASSTQNAHRALWASPSHRTNMLSGDLGRVGVAVTKDADGRVWVTQLFSD